MKSDDGVIRVKTKDCHVFNDAKEILNRWMKNLEWTAGRRQAKHVINLVSEWPV